LLAAAVAVAAVALGVAGSLAWRGVYAPFRGWDGSSVDVVLEPGLDAGTMVARLAQAGVVRDPRLAKAWLLVRGDAARLHAGEYRFERPASVPEVMDRLVRGDVLLHPVTIPEGWTLDRVAARFATHGFGTEAAMSEAFADPTPIRDWDRQAVDLEGYLFPDTYHFPRRTPPNAIAAALVERFRSVVGEGYEARARAAGLDLRSAVTLASLIEAETSVGAERARVSRVFHNRLARGMRLECDPTVQYALARAGRPVERLTYRDLAFESPWNTYRVSGLPPGPICSPGRASLDAAVDPAAGDDLFFVAAPGGGHSFSPDLATHLRAVAVWRRYSRSSR
jgi:UPF0755 protein